MYYFFVTRTPKVLHFDACKCNWKRPFPIQSAVTNVFSPNENNIQYKLSYLSIYTFVYDAGIQEYFRLVVLKKMYCVLSVSKLMVGEMSDTFQYLYSFQSYL